MKNEAKIWHLIVGLIGAMMVVLAIVFMMFSSMGMHPTFINTQIVVAIVSSLGTIGAATIARDFKKKKDLDNKPDLSELNYDDVLGPIISSIQEKFDLFRCAYWVYTNGTYTGDDHGLQNCSMVVEKNREGVREVIGEMQMIPKIQFRRNISPLRENLYHISHEDEHDDALAHFNAGYGIKTALFFKAMNRGRWTGVLGIGFDESKRKITDDEIAWISIQVSRIEAIIRNLKNKQ